MEKKHKLDVDKEVAIEWLWRETEQAKITLQTTRLELVRDGKLLVDVLQEEGNSSALSSGSSDVMSNLRLLPKFNERDPDVFFVLFERLAEVRK